MAVTAAEDWRVKAACIGAPNVLFAPHEERDQFKRSREAKALEICAVCPVKAECLEVAERFGIWGGTTEDMRSTSQRAQRRLRQQAKIEGFEGVIARLRLQMPAWPKSEEVA